MQVMSAKREPNTISVLQRLSLIASVVAVGVFEHPQVWNAGVVDLIPVSKHSCARPCDHFIETIRKDGGFVRDEVTIFIHQQSDSIVLAGVVSSLFTEVLHDVRVSIFNRLGGQIVIQPVTMSTVVLDAFALAEGLAGVEFSLRVYVEGHDVGQHRFCGEERPADIFG